jgi:hypothetical protein
VLSIVRLAAFGNLLDELWLGMLDDWGDTLYFSFQLRVWNEPANPQ